MIFKRSSIGLGFSWIDGSSCKVGWNTWLPPISTSQPLSCHNVWMLFKVQQQWTSTYIYILYYMHIHYTVHSQWWPWAWIGTQYTSYNCNQSVRKKHVSLTSRGCQMVSQITGQHWRMMSSLFLSTGAVQLVPGALIRRGVLLGTSHGFCWIILPSGKLT